VKDIRETNRGAKGVKLLSLAEGDRLLSIARIVETDEETGEGGGTEAQPTTAL
jgi:DNA gyrase subunit A